MNVVSKLKQLNTLPFPVALKYYVPFGLSTEVSDNKHWSGEEWLVLRNQHPRYRIAETREEWLADLALDKDGQDAYLHDRVESFAQLLEREHLTTIYSIGSGGGVFEYYLKKRSPQVKVVATECTKEGVERLRRVAPELDEVRIFDALKSEDWLTIGDDPHAVVFLYRNEREFSDAQWKKMWSDMYAANIPQVFLGLMWTLTARSLLQLKIRNLRNRLAGKHLSFVGYIRNFRGLERLWKGAYRVQETIPFPTCTGLYLKRYTEPV